MTDKRAVDEAAEKYWKKYSSTNAFTAFVDGADWALRESPVVREMREALQVFAEWPLSETPKGPHVQSVFCIAKECIKAREALAAYDEAIKEK